MREKWTQEHELCGFSYCHICVPDVKVLASHCLISICDSFYSIFFSLEKAHIFYRCSVQSIFFFRCFSVAGRCTKPVDCSMYKTLVMRAT